MKMYAKTLIPNTYGKIEQSKIYYTLNTGNFIITKSIIDNITYDESKLFMTTSSDVLYFNLLAFQQFPDFQFHIVENLEYIHAVHDDGEYLKTHHNCDDHTASYIMPQYQTL